MRRNPTLKDFYLIYSFWDRSGGLLIKKPVWGNRLRCPCQLLKLELGTSLPVEALLFLKSMRTQLTSVLRWERLVWKRGRRLGIGWGVNFLFAREASRWAAENCSLVGWALCSSRMQASTALLRCSAVSHVGRIAITSACLRYITNASVSQQALLVW